MQLRIKELREKSGISQKAVADEIGVSLRALQNYEQGTREPSYKILCKLADFYGVTTDYLLGRDEKAPDAVEQLAREFGLSEIEKLFIQAYFMADKKERQNFVNFAEKIVEEKEKLSQETQPNPIRTKTPTTYTCGELEDIKQAEADEAKDAG